MDFPKASPSFTPRDPAGNALEFCELFGIAREEHVPVASYRICFEGGGGHSASIGPGKYKWALCLLYLATLAGNTNFEFITSLRQYAIDRFGPDLMHEVAQHQTRDQTLHALSHHRAIYVSLELTDGFNALLDNLRHPEIITWAWERSDTITPASPEPILRRALATFFGDLEAKRLEMSDEPGHWLTYEWGDRALELQRRLTPS